jgi:transcriptional accessory protein Tex/SPT6
MATLVMGSAIAFAHEGVQHVMGTVTAVTDTSITVDTTQHNSVTVMVAAATKFTNKNVKSALKDLKVGDRVAIDAKEIADEKLQAVSVKWGASSGTKMPAGMKMPADQKK